MSRQISKSVVDPFTSIDSDAEWHEKGWATESEPLTAAAQLGLRISVDLVPEDAALVRRAAQLLGLTRSAFVQEAAIAAATEAIRRSEQ